MKTVNLKQIEKSKRIIYSAFPSKLLLPPYTVFGNFTKIMKGGQPEIKDDQKFWQCQSLVVEFITVKRQILMSNSIKYSLRRV